MLKKGKEKKEEKKTRVVSKMGWHFVMVDSHHGGLSSQWSFIKVSVVLRERFNT